MKIGIVGCGLIGGKRAAAIKVPHQIVGVCDVIAGKAEIFAASCRLREVYISDS